MINTAVEKEHQYTLRSCLNCSNLPTCHVRFEVDSPSIWADKAKYGCRLYTSTVEEYRTERKRRDELKR